MSISNVSSLLPPAANVVSGATSSAAQPTATNSPFEQLWGTINNLNNQQQSAQNEVQSVLSGQSNNVQGALIAMEKASLQIQLASTVSTKLVSGYNTLMNMQV